MSTIPKLRTLIKRFRADQRGDGGQPIMWIGIALVAIAIVAIITTWAITYFQGAVDSIPAIGG